MSFTTKRIDVTIEQGQGTFGADGVNRIVLTGHRVSATITKGALPSFDSLPSLRIWGLRPQDMRAVSTLGKQAYFNRVNNVIVSAGDDKGMTTVYQGTIIDAFQDASGPDMALNIVSNAGTLNGTRPVSPRTFNKPTEAALIAQQIASAWQPSALGFENHGVTTVVPPCYLPGTLVEQLRRLKDMAGIEGTVDNDVLAIWPRGGTRDGLIPSIGPGTGLVGYPRFADSGFVSLTTEFLPGLRLGGLFNLETSLDPASGQYFSNTLGYELESEMPDGKWFANLTALRPGNGL